MYNIEMQLTATCISFYAIKLQVLNIDHSLVMNLY
jgi:hypothetical protein